jgi:AcrR family transcriptional regulator
MGQLRRRSIISAVAQLVSEDGVESATTSQIIARASVSEDAFYRHFDGREDCLRSAFEEFVRLARERVLTVAPHRRRWVDRIRIGMLAVLELIESEREWAMLAATLALAPSPAVASARTELLEELASVLDEGRGLPEAPGQMPPLLAEGIVGGVLSVIAARLRARDPRSLTELATPLFGFVVLPYLGPEATRREMERALAASELALTPAPRSLELRLTYRTMLVLSAMARHPSLSNRELARAVGIGDEGQISKLLSRIERHELARNSGPGQSGGGRNSWTLTRKGEELHRAAHGLLMGVEEDRATGG